MSKARSLARRLAMQGIYEWQMSENSPTDIHDHNVATDKLKKLDAKYYEALLRGVHKCLAEIDSAFEPFLKRPITEIDPIELAILRLAVYELIYRVDVPYRVVINEAIDLAKIALKHYSALVTMLHF